MFIKNYNNFKNIQEIVEFNTKTPIAEFLHPDEMPYIHGLEEAVQILVQNANRQVTIVGDYDADGICATAIMYWGLRAYGIYPQTRLPHRFSEGYGLSEKIIDEIPEGVVITVDNGIAAHKAIKKAKEKGLIVIVTDHHLATRDSENNRILPDADVVVDPNAEDVTQYKEYCGAGIAFRFAQELLKDKNINLDDLLVMASIATVCDVMKLVGANRILVKKGLEAINLGKGLPGLRMILTQMNLTDHITEEDYGYRIGPTINAAGRLIDDGSEQALKLFMMGKENPYLESSAKHLLELNEVRKKKVKDWMPIVDRLSHGMRPVVVYHPEIEEGIIGILAAELTEKYQCPTIVFTKMKNGNLKGSGRSINGIHLKNVLDKIQEHILGYGGHEGAAGLLISSGSMNSFKDAFNKAVGTLPEIQEENRYDLDLLMKSNNLETIMNDLKLFAPFGNGNPKPILRLKFSVTNYKRIGDGKSFMMPGKSMSLMGFNLVEKYENMGNPSTINCIGELQENWYKGNCYYQFLVKNFEDATK